MLRTAFLIIVCAILSGCADQQADQSQPTAGAATGEFEPNLQVLENGEASHITVQHILIGFKGSVPGKPITRSKEEAAELAREVLEQAKSGEDFDQLVKKYTDDAAPGIYRMANHGEQAFMRGNPDDYVYARASMVPAFGDVGFPLQVGEIGMSEFDPAASPFGWHIVKRVK